MINKLLGTLALGAAASTLAVAAPAEARGGAYYEASSYQHISRDGYREYRRGDRYRGDRRAYRDQRYYRDDRRYYSDNRYSNDRRYYDNRRDDRYRCDRGNGGTIVGAIAGGLLGNEIAGRGDRTVGTIIGGAAGALAGRAIDRDC